MTTMRKHSEQDQQKIKYVEGPHYAASYCNNIAYALNALDFVLIFGEIVDASQEHITVEQRARITMAPAQAKILSLVLNEQLALYEERTRRPIFIPDGMVNEEE